MLEDGKKEKISHIVHGTILEGQQDSLTTIRNLLCSGYPTSRTVKKKFESQLLVKKEQADFLIQYCKSHHLFINILPGEDQFIARGGEASVYLSIDRRNVIKLMMLFIMPPGSNFLTVWCFIIFFSLPHRISFSAFRSSTTN
jgi:hypothetical protein